MKKVTVHAAKTQLSRLLKYAEAGEEVIICRGDKPVARLLKVAEAPPRRKFGAMRGRATVTDAFFLPLPPEELRGWGE